VQKATAHPENVNTNGLIIFVRLVTKKVDRESRLS
jgi:hypothetical protein